MTPLGGDASVSFVAGELYCPHMGALLPDGMVGPNGSLRCAFHGYEFGADGVELKNRCARLSTVPLHVRDGWLLAYQGPDCIVSRPADWPEAELSWTRVDVDVPPIFVMANPFDFEHLLSVHEYGPEQRVINRSFDEHFGHLEYETSLVESGMTRRLRARYEFERAASIRSTFWVDEELRGEVRLYLNWSTEHGTTIHLGVLGVDDTARALSIASRLELARDRKIWNRIRLDRLSSGASTQVREFLAWAYPGSQ